MANNQSSPARNTSFLFYTSDKAFNLSVQTSNICDFTLGETAFPNGREELMVPSNTILKSDLVMQFIISENWEEWIGILRWMIAARKSTNPFADGTYRSGTLVPLDSQLKPAMYLNYHNMWPTALDGVQFNTMEDQSASVTASVTMKHSGFNLTTLSGEVIDEKLG